MEGAPILLRSAIVRPPSLTFASGLTRASLGPPDLGLAKAQHRAYCDALERCGLEVHALEPDSAHPDSTFVEDTAVITPGGAVLARPGAPSRRGEVESIRHRLSDLGIRLRTIDAPGTLDGGDVCDRGRHFLIGLSERTKEPGARQLAAFLEADGCSSSIVDVRSIPDLLHLKSGLAALDRGRVVVTEALQEHPALSGSDRVRVEASESHGANCVLVNGRVLLPQRCPGLEERLIELGYETIALDISEFRKMDGGLSCLSLRLGGLTVPPTPS